MKRFMLLFSLLLVCFSCTNNTQEVVKVKEEERRAIMLEWLAGAEEVVAATKDEEAIEILEAIKRFGFLAMPIANENEDKSVQAIDDVPNELYKIALMPLFIEDGKLNGAWDKEIKNKTPASFESFSNNMGLLTFKQTEEFSPRIKGLMLLHEGKHMLKEISGELEDLKKEDELAAAAIDEYRAFETEARLVRILGGKDYKKLLLRAISVLEHKIRRDETIIFAQPFYPEELKQIFGSPSTQNELTIMERMLWADALMSAFDRVFGYNTYEGNTHKIRFFAQFYAQKIEI